MIDRFNLKKRNFIGTTSMEAELSLLVANQALARNGSLVSTNTHSSAIFNAVNTLLAK
jgi:hypothetical protein